MAQLSTHVLDPSRGQPAANLRIDLYRAGKLVKTVTTNADGRTSEPLLSGDRVPAGVFERVFSSGGLFRGLVGRACRAPVHDGGGGPCCVAGFTATYALSRLLLR